MNLEQFRIDLAEACRLAKISACLVDDGGTCNMDGMMLKIPNIKHSRIIDIAHSVGIGCWFSECWKAFVFGVPISSHGNRRTEQAEVMKKIMEERGYDASVYYQMD